MRDRRRNKPSELIGTFPHGPACNNQENALSPNPEQNHAEYPSLSPIVPDSNKSKGHLTRRIDNPRREPLRPIRFHESVEQISPPGFPAMPPYLHHLVSHTATPIPSQQGVEVYQHTKVQYHPDGPKQQEPVGVLHRSSVRLVLLT